LFFTAIVTGDNNDKIQDVEKGLKLDADLFEIKDIKK